MHIRVAPDVKVGTKIHLNSFELASKNVNKSLKALNRNTGDPAEMSDAYLHKLTLFKMADGELW